MRRGIVVALLLAASSAWADYVPPVGIPAPSFGINEVAPDTATYCPGWPTSANGGADNCYYIDNEHAASTDTANVFGYPDKPRKTPPTTYNAGSYVEIHGGTYTGASAVWTTNGTAEKPVWIRGTDNGANMPAIQHEVVTNGAYTIYENLKMVELDQPFIHARVKSGVGTSDHIAVRYCSATGTGTGVAFNSSFGVTGDNTHAQTNIVFYGNTVSGYSDMGRVLAEEADWHAFAPSQYGDNVWVLNNTAYNVGGDGCQVGVASIPDYARLNHVYVGGNTFYDTGENAVDVKEGNNVIVSSNVGHGFSYSSHDPGGGIPVHNSPDNVWVINNTIYDAATGILSSGATGLRIVGNLIYGIHHDNNAGAWNPLSAYADGAGVQIYSSATADIVNNTIWDTDIGVETDTGTAYNLVNNIIGGRSSALGYDIAYGNSTAAANTVIDNNIIYSDNAVRIRWGSATTYDLAAFQSATEKCAFCGDTIPAFNVGDNVYTLPAGSIAIDNGAVSAVYDAFVDVYGLSIAKDIAGTTRPRDATFDIGAYEYGGEIPADNTAPSVPSNVAAVALSTSSVRVTWDASTDDTAVVGYYLYRGGVHYQTVYGLTYTDTGLAASTEYVYAVEAFDAVGNESADSDDATVTTDAYPVARPSVFRGRWCQ